MGSRATPQWDDTELAKRKKVWSALSNLFLDTDVTLSEESVVRELASSPYDIDTLETILEREVSPVCKWNVFWWEWAGFDVEWLAENILRNLSRPRVLRLPPIFGRHGLGPRGYWDHIKSRVQQARRAAV